MGNKKKDALTLLLFIVFAMVGQGNAMSADYTHYLMAYFTGNAKAQEQIRYALSTDGTVFGALNGGNPVVAGADIANAGAVRDPYITRGHDGDTYSYYMVATDMTSTGGWTNKGLVILRSKDLINWEHKAFDFSTYFSDWSDVSCVWAPEIIWDATASKYLIYYALKSASQTGSVLKIYYSYISDDFTSITAPVLMYCYNSSATIDADIIEHSGTYYMFFKSEASEKRIRMTTSTSLTDWSNATASVVVGQIDEAQEGPCIFQLIGQQKWILMYDLYGRSTGTFHQCTTTDFSTFTAQGYLTGISPRHGAVMWLTDDETTRLQTWSKLNVLLSSLNSDDASSTEATAAKTAISDGETSSMQSAYDALLAKVNADYSNVTSTYLTNTDFETSPTFDGTSTGTSGSVNATVTTGSTLTNSSYVNVYNIDGWTTRTNSGVSDYARTFTMPYGTTLYVKSNGTAGGQAVTSPANGSSVTSGNNDLLFVEANWCQNAALGIYKTVTLPAGSYRLTFDSYVGTSLSNATSLCGVSYNNKTRYAWPTALDTWTPETVAFVLTQATDVTISMGYTKTGNTKGTESPFLFVDNVKLLKKPVAEQPTPSDPIEITNEMGLTKSDWTGATGNYTAATPNNLVEHYGNPAWSGSVMYQTLTGLSNGLYDVSMYCDASQAWITTPTVTDGATGYTTLYANTTTKDVPVYKRTAVTTADVLTLSDVEVTDGTLTIGIRNDQAGANWIIAQIKSLLYKGPKVDTEAYAAALSEAQALYAAGTTSAAVRTMLKAAIADTPTSGDAWSYLAKTKALQTAVGAAKASAAAAVTGSNSYTSLIVNPNIASTTGWTINRGSGNHDTTTGDPAVSGDTTPYLDSWAATWTTQYNATQTVNNLPDGTYKLTATVRSNIANGVSISMTSGSNTASASSTANTSWNTISATCLVTDGSLTINVDGHLSDGGWLSADDFTLTYLGNGTADASGKGFAVSAQGLTEAQAEAALTTFSANGARTADFGRATFDDAVTDGTVDNVTTNANLLVLDAAQTFTHAIHVNSGALTSGSLLTDRCPFYAAAAYTGTLTYTRTITNGATYGTLLLPFAVSATDAVKLYKPTSLSGSVLSFTETTTAEANVPCLFHATATSFTLSGDGIAATPTATSNTYMAGVYETVNIPTTSYVLSKDKFYYVDNSTVTLAPFRAYFTVPEANGVKSLDLNIEGQPTAIDDALHTAPLVVLTGKGYLLLHANTAVKAGVYDTSGRRYAEPSMKAGEELTLHVGTGVYIVKAQTTTSDAAPRRVAVK